MDRWTDRHTEIKKVPCLLQNPNKTVEVVFKSIQKECSVLSSGYFCHWTKRQTMFYFYLRLSCFIYRYREEKQNRFLSFSLRLLFFVAALFSLLQVIFARVL